MSNKILDNVLDITKSVCYKNSYSNIQRNYLISNEDRSSKFEYYFENYFFNFYDITVLFLNVTSIYFYILSLEGCEGTQVECLSKINPSYFLNLGIYGATAGATLSLSLVFIIFKRAKFYHFLYLSVFYSYLIKNDFGANLDKHGSYNFYFLVIILSVLIPFLLLIKYIFNRIKKNYVFTSFIMTLILAFIILTTINKVSSTTCYDFYMGLGGRNVTNNINEDKCTMVYPKKCIMEKVKGFFDMSYYLRKKCSNRDPNERNNLNDLLKPQLKWKKRYGFPLTQQFSLKEQRNIADFNGKVLNALFDLDKIENAYTPHEVELTFDDKNVGEISMKIKRNINLVEEREKKRNVNDTKTTNLYKNVLIIYIDAISRNHFIRKMKETSKFIEKRLYAPKKKETTKHSSFQFLKYNNINAFTQINVGPMFYGKPMNSNSGFHVLQHFKDKGYITGQSSNLCSRELFAVERHYHVSRYTWSDFDHENVAMFCDPNYHNRNDPYPLNRGAFSIMRRCLYGKDTYEYVMEYADQFWSTYLDQPKVFRMGFIDAHEATGEVVGYLDKPLVAFLKNWEKKGFLDDTAIFFISDHGNNMGEFYKLMSNDFETERTLGTLFILLPKLKDGKKDKQIKDNLLYNEQKLITPYDIYDTLLHIVFDDNFEARKKSRSSNGQSLFDKINGKERSCDKYRNDMKGEFCRCQKFN